MITQSLWHVSAVLRTPQRLTKLPTNSGGAALRLATHDTKLMVEFNGLKGVVDRFGDFSGTDGTNRMHGRFTGGAIHLFEERAIPSAVVKGVIINEYKVVLAPPKPNPNDSVID